MDKIHPGIQAETVFELIQLDDRSVPVDVTLAYEAGQPHAVHLTLVLAGSDSVAWLVSRDLLAEGFVAPVGDGDIRLSPLSDQHALLELRSAEGEAWFRIPTDEMLDFLEDSYQLVPKNREAEWLDMDSSLSALLAVDVDLGDANRKDR
jgi:hypothetical protein